MKRSGTLLLVLALTLPLTARGDDASRHSKARELISELHVEHIVTSLINSVNAQTNAITQRVAPATPTPAQTSAIDAFHKKVLEVVQSQINWPALQPAYIDLYARTFTDEELDGILAFYKTPAGKALLEKSPALTLEAQKIPQQKLIELQPQLNQAVQDFQKQMSAAPPAATPAPAAKPK